MAFANSNLAERERETSKKVGKKERGRGGGKREKEPGEHKKNTKKVIGRVYTSISLLLLLLLLAPGAWVRYQRPSTIG